MLVASATGRSRGGRACRRPRSPGAALEMSAGRGGDRRRRPGSTGVERIKIAVLVFVDAPRAAPT